MVDIVNHSDVTEQGHWKQTEVTFPENSRPTEVERPSLIIKHRMEATSTYFPQIIKH